MTAGGRAARPDRITSCWPALPLCAGSRIRRAGTLYRGWQAGAKTPIQLLRPPRGQNIKVAIYSSARLRWNPCHAARTVVAIFQFRQNLSCDASAFRARGAGKFFRELPGFCLE